MYVRIKYKVFVFAREHSSIRREDGNENTKCTAANNTNHSPSKSHSISTQLLLTGAELFECTKPLGFLLTKVDGIDDMYNNTGAMSLKGYYRMIILLITVVH